MMTPSDQISQDLSYFSGPNTSGAENTISREPGLGGYYYQHSRGYSRGSAVSPWSESPLQSQSLWVSRPRDHLGLIFYCVSKLANYPTLCGVEQVLRLEISVSNIHIMQELYSQADILHYLCCFCKIHDNDLIKKNITITKKTKTIWITITITIKKK